MVFEQRVVPEILRVPSSREEGADNTLHQNSTSSSSMDTAKIEAVFWDVFAYNWKFPAYNGAFLLTIDNLGFLTYNWSCFVCSLSFF